LIKGNQNRFQTLKLNIMNTFIKTLANDNAFPRLFNSLLNESELGISLSIPAVNIKETDELFEIQLAAPGLKKEDFKIDLTNGKLNISVEQKEENEVKEERFHRKEFSFKAFSRSFKVPSLVDTEKIEAIYEDGVLNLSLPKKEEAKPKEPKLIAVG
jgi:HSP20 family protein